MNTQSPHELSQSTSVASRVLTVALDSDTTPTSSANTAELPDEDEMQEMRQALGQKIAECKYLNCQLQEAVQKRQQLEQQLQWYEDSEQVLATIAALNYHYHHLSQTLQDIVWQVHTVLQADRVCLYRLQADRSSFVMAEAVRSGLPAIAGFRIRDAFVSSPEWIERYQNGQTCIIPDLSNIDQTAEATPNSSGIVKPDPSTDTLLRYFQVKAKLVLPIHIHQQLWGFLVIHQCATPRHWQKPEINFLKQLTWQLGMAIEQQQLHQELQGLQERLAIQRQSQAICLQQTLAFEAMLTRITDRVRDSLDEQQILQTAVQELTKVLEADCCQAVLCDPEQATCEVKFEYRAPLLAASEPQPRQKPFDDPVAYPDELCRQIHQGGLCQFCCMEPYLNRGQEAILIAPILDDQRCLGSLRVFTRYSHSFDASETRLVQQVANHCAIALRQARLFAASQTQVKAMERLHQLKDDFLSTISHELRTPLSSIKMVTNLLNMMFKSATKLPNPDQAAIGVDSSKVTQYLKVLEEECDREINLIDDLLSAQHLNAGNHPISLMPIQLQEWIPHIAETFAQRLQTQQQTLKLIIPTDLPPLVSDTFMLNRILVELLNNACKYTPVGETITVEAAHTPSQIEIAVKNSGIEIASDELTHVFDPFYRIPSNDPWKQSGTGLGLSLTRKLVEYLGGTIQVESHTNQVCFKVQFPASI
jgi:signal transduction histidine kinase